jgi:hypothetical protein
LSNLSLHNFPSTDGVAAVVDVVETACGCPLNNNRGIQHHPQETNQKASMDPTIAS